MTRAGVNTIIEHKLYQRAQILTWPREQKYKLFSDLGITLVVNLWPKVDPDMDEMPTTYLFIPASRSIMLTHRRFAYLATAVAKILEEDETALILCEAGKTRSVYFSVLVVQMLLKVDRIRALEIVEKGVPEAKLRPKLREALVKGLAVTDDGPLLLMS